MAMRIFKFLLAVGTAWALSALPAVQADAHPGHGGHRAAGHGAKGHATPKANESDCCKPAAKPAAKPVESDCCKPAAKPAAKAAESDCCKPAAKPAAACNDKAACGGACNDKAACGGACNDKAACGGACNDKAACGGACKDKAACGGACKDKAACGGACKDKAACGGACKDKAACQPSHGQRWTWGMKAHGRRAMAVSYLPAAGAATNQHVLLTTSVSTPITSNLSLGRQMNLALQAPLAQGNGPWLSTFGGFMPRLTTDVGPLNVQLGALLGGGAMFRTVAATTPANLLQANLFWAVHPQLKLAAAGDELSGVTVGYLLTSQQAELGGPTVGFQWGWKHGR
jgi:hypothetical protein